MMEDDGLLLSKFWGGKNVLITGHTGFKGSWLTLWLYKLGANVSGVALKPDSKKNLYDALMLDRYCNSHLIDIRDSHRLSRICKTVNPEVIFHLAAQPLVRESYKDPVGTYEINLMGSVNVLECARSLGNIEALIMVTTDKVYSNKGIMIPYEETDRLGGYDPYSASKAASEIIIDSYRKSFFKNDSIAISSARSGNVLGGGDWSSDRLIPDAMQAWGNGLKISVRNPRAIRPWQHVLDSLHGYLKLAEKTANDKSLSGAYNFGPTANQAASVEDVLAIARSNFGSGDIEYIDDSIGPHEELILLLASEKAKNKLAFHQKWNLETTIKRTVEWYRGYKLGITAEDLCNSDIANYEGLN